MSSITNMRHAVGTLYFRAMMWKMEPTTHLRVDPYNGSLRHIEEKQ